MKKQVRFRACQVASTVVLALTFARVARADAAADTLLKQCVAAQSRLQSIQATAVIRRIKNGRAGVIRAKLVLQKPNLAWLELPAAQGETGALISSDGKNITSFINDSNGGSYTVLPVDKRGINFAAVVTPVSGGVESTFFFDPQVGASILLGKKPQLVGAITVDGTRCRVLRGTNEAGTVFQLYVAADNLIRGGSLSVKGTTIETQLIGVKYNMKAPASRFTWTPPKGSKAVPMDEFLDAKQRQTSKPHAKKIPAGGQE